LLRAYAAVAAILAFTSAASAATDERCGVPDYLIEPQASLPRVLSAVKRTQRLDVLVLSGAPSQMNMAKGPRSYPSFFEAAMSEELPRVRIRVDVRAAPRRSVMEVQPLLPALLAEVKPNLVIWQSGTVEAYRGIDAHGFSRSLLAGASTLIVGGTDVILVNMQYSPRTELLVDIPAYNENMRWVTESLDIPFFNRYAIMRHWSDTGAFDLAAFKSDSMFEKIHFCLGRLLANFVVRAASLSEFKGAGQ
jgi:hypothetical protein